jgi:hypothetical protein
MNICFLRMYYPYSGTEYAIKSALKHNQNARVIFLGDEVNKMNLCEFQNIEFYKEDFNRFQKIFIHRSRNPLYYDLATFGQWIILSEFCRKNNLKTLCALDTDVLTFSNLKEAQKPFEIFDYTISRPDDSFQCPTLFLNTDVLFSFSDFLFEQYTNKLSSIPNDHELSSMYLWHLFSNKKLFIEGDTSKIFNETTFDHNAALDYHGYEFDGKTRVIRFHQGQPYSYNFKINKLIRFHTIHCWGYWKNKEQDLIKMSL